MQVTSLYWRQLYLYLSTQQRKQRLSLRRAGVRPVAQELPLRPPRIYGSVPRRPSSLPN